MSVLESKHDLNFKLLINSRKNLLLAIVLIWASVILTVFAIKPQIENIFSMNHKLDLEKKQFQKITLKLNELKQIQISDQFKQKEKVDEVLPSHKPILELLYNLHQTMQDTQVTVTSLLINPGKIASESAELELIATSETSSQAGEVVTKKPKKFDFLQMELVVRGEPDKVDQFLEIVERITPFTSIVELSIKDSKKQTGEKSATLGEAQILLNTYFYTQVITTSIESTLPTVGEKELRAFNTIQQFVPSDYQIPSDIQNSNIEDMFDISGFKF